jgi:hypothetical protein
MPALAVEPPTMLLIAVDEIVVTPLVLFETPSWT